MVIKYNPKTKRYYVAPSPPSFYKPTPSAGGMSKIGSPTPSAGEITGTAKEKEAQIQAFRRGGQSSLIKERKKAEARIKQEVHIKQEQRAKQFIQKQRQEEIRKRLGMKKAEDKTRFLFTPRTTPLKPIHEVQPYKRPKELILQEITGLSKLTSKQRLAREELRTKKLRGTITKTEEAKLLLYTAGQIPTTLAKELIGIPETIYNIAKNPSVLKKIPGELSRGGKEFGEILRTSPGEGLILAGGEFLKIVATGGALSRLSKTSSSTLTKLNPKYVGESKVGQTLEIKTGGGKTIDLKVVGKIPKEKLSSQVSKAGKTIKLAISSQADNLLGIIQKYKGMKIRKPIPGEANFNKATKVLLAQFDKGIISKKNLLKLNEAIKGQGAKGLLERAFFADPSGKIRPSRLGVIKDKKGSVLDYLAEDITFRKAKPQILLFENVKIQALPKALKSVGNKLKKGLVLTKKETDNLLKYQLKKSGKFKGVGFLSGESEIILAPGEILKRVKKVGVTIANGKRIPIVKAEVFKPTGKIKNLITQAKKGTLSKAKLKQLEKELKKATGFNYGLSSVKKVAGKYISVKKIGADILSKISRGKKETIKITTTEPTKYKPVTHKDPWKSKPKPKAPSKPKPKAPSKPKPPSKKPVSKPTYRRTKRIRAISLKKPYKPVSKKPYKPVSKKPYKPVKAIITPKPKTKKPIKIKPKRKIQAYNVYARPLKKKKGDKKPKLMKVNKVPLSKARAKNLRNYITDTSLARTSRIKPTKGTPKKPRLKVPSGYAKKTKNKFRTHRIVKGKRRPLPKGKVIEKRKRLLDTRQEKKQITLAKRVKQITPKRKVVKKATRPTRPTKKPIRRTARKTTPPKRTTRTKRTTTRKPTRRK